MARIFPDISPLRTSRDYRLLWLGQLVSQAGSGLRLVAIPYQVYVLTGSSLAVGLIGLFSAIPLMSLSLFGGVVADRTDRRRLLFITQVFLALTSFALALATQLGYESFTSRTQPLCTATTVSPQPRLKSYAFRFH